MTTFDYSRLHETAVRLLKRFGRSMSVRTVDLGGFDPVTGVPVNPQTSDVSCNGVDVTNLENLYSEFTIEQGDKVVFIDKPIRIEDRLVIDSVIWQVVNVREVNPAGTYILTQVQVRK